MSFSDGLERFFRVLLLFFLVVAGVAMVYLGLNAPPEPTPDVEQNSYAAPTQEPVGPTAMPSPGDPQERLDVLSMGRNTLMVPSIGAYGAISNASGYGSIRDGAMVLPPAKLLTSWVDGAKVGDNNGSILVTGHISYNGTRGVLYDLAKVESGELAYIKNAKGEPEAYKLEAMESFKKQALPEKVWDTKGPKKLLLVTCGGKLTKAANGSWHFDNNIVATFTPLKDAELREIGLGYLVKSTPAPTASSKGAALTRGTAAASADTVPTGGPIPRP